MESDADISSFDRRTDPLVGLETRQQPHLIGEQVTVRDMVYHLVSCNKLVWNTWKSKDFHCV